MIKNQNLAQTTLAVIKSCQQRAENLKCLVDKAEFSTFMTEYLILHHDLNEVSHISTGLQEEEEFFATIKDKLLVNIFHSLERIMEMSKTRDLKCSPKIEFELSPLLKMLGISFYYCSFIKGDQEKEDHFEKYEYNSLIANDYIKESQKTGQYKYEVSFVIFAYNKLEYTKQCVESFLKTVDPNLNYELILVNHGSSDGTKEYFQSVGCTKQIDIKENDLVFSSAIASLAVEGQYLFYISNDIIFCENSISNLLACFKSEEAIRFAVPSTTNMLNNQEPTLPESCTSVSDIVKWGNTNNVSNPNLWERRVMLHNPVAIHNSCDMIGENAMLLVPFFLKFTGFEGNDETISGIIRRNGMKMMLAKDAFCYHADHVTRKNARYDTDAAYRQRKYDALERAKSKSFVTGRGYSRTMMQEIPIKGSDHKDILGLQCGLTSNPFRVKEQFREKLQNLDCKIKNIQDSDEFFQEISSFSDETVLVETYSKLEQEVSGKTYYCIIWEDAFHFPVDEATFYPLLLDSLVDEGVLLVGQPSEEAKKFFKGHKIVEYYNHQTMIDCLVYHKK